MLPRNTRYSWATLSTQIFPWALGKTPPNKSPISRCVFEKLVSTEGNVGRQGPADGYLKHNYYRVSQSLLNPVIFLHPSYCQILHFLLGSNEEGGVRVSLGQGCALHESSGEGGLGLSPRLLQEPFLSNLYECIRTSASW